MSCQAPAWPWAAGGAAGRSNRSAHHFLSPYPPVLFSLSPNGGEGWGEGGIKCLATPTLTLPPQGGGNLKSFFLLVPKLRLGNALCLAKLLLGLGQRAGLRAAVIALPTIFFLPIPQFYSPSPPTGERAGVRGESKSLPPPPAVAPSRGRSLSPNVSM